MRTTRRDPMITAVERIVYTLGLGLWAALMAKAIFG